MSNEAPAAASAARTARTTYACEHDDVPCRAYVVTGHDGTVARCIYCEDCAALAECDWNGETAKIEVAAPAATVAALLAADPNVSPAFAAAVGGAR